MCDVKMMKSVVAVFVDFFVKFILKSCHVISPRDFYQSEIGAHLKTCNLLRIFFLPNEFYWVIFGCGFETDKRKNTP